MDRRGFLGVLVSGLFAAGSPVEAQQQTPRPYVTGYLGQGSKSDELAPARDLPTLLETADLDRLFEEMARERDQALLVWSNPHLNLYRKQIFDLTLRYRLPALYDVRGYPEELLVYAAKLDDVHREAATYVDKILKGANAGNLAIGQAKTFQLIVNLRAAKALGITVPQSLLLRADEVIQ